MVELSNRKMQYSTIHHVVFSVVNYVHVIRYAFHFTSFFFTLKYMKSQEIAGEEKRKKSIENKKKLWKKEKEIHEVGRKKSSKMNVKNELKCHNN